MFEPISEKDDLFARLPYMTQYFKTLWPYLCHTTVFGTHIYTHTYTHGRVAVQFRILHKV